MIFLGNLTKINDNKYSIGFVHYMPFHKENGLNKTKEELQNEGALLETIEEPLNNGMAYTMYYNPNENKTFYEYSEIVREITIEEKVKSLEEQNAMLEEAVLELASIIGGA